MIRHKLCGVGAAMITPFTPEGKVDYQALACMIDYVIEGGVDYIVALGTTAETPTLYMPESPKTSRFRSVYWIKVFTFAMFSYILFQTTSINALDTLCS